MAESLAKGKKYPMLDDEPEYCAITMLSVLESLWKARTELARMKKKPPKGDGFALNDGLGLP
jgi:hypothetical protein